VPDTGAAAPAMVMSLKSASVPEKAAQVSVRVVPIVSERKNFRMVASVPADIVSVPLIVWLAANETILNPAAVVPVNDRLLKVLTPLITYEALGELFVNATLYKVFPFPEKLGIPFKFICEVPAVIVNSAEVAIVVPKAKSPWHVNVEDPKFILRVLVLFDEKFPEVRLYVFNKNDPFVMVIVLKPLLNALPNVHSQPTPLIVELEDSATPFVVSVLPVDDPLSVILPV
jgi:hypothetical protein